VSEEYQRVAAEHGGAANTPHEGYALVKGEVEEAGEQISMVYQKVTDLWCAVVRMDDLPRQAELLAALRRAAILGACKLIQVAAMADKAMAGIRKEWNG